MKKNTKFKNVSKSKVITLRVSHELYKEYQGAAKHMSEKIGGMKLSVQDYLKLCSELAIYSINKALEAKENIEDAVFVEDTVINSTVSSKKIEVEL